MGVIKPRRLKLFREIKIPLTPKIEVCEKFRFFSKMGGEYFAKLSEIVGVRIAHMAFFLIIRSTTKFWGWRKDISDIFRQVFTPRPLAVTPCNKNG